MAPKKEHPSVKTSLHPRNKHRARYPFKKLINSCPALAPFVRLNPYNDESIDFSNPEAVLMLNKALLKHYYSINHWTIPSGYLCPPIPGRADYIHHLADLLASYNHGVVPIGPNIKGLDVGVGANCIYPIIGNKEYGWSFVGCDVDAVALKSAAKIIDTNPSLKRKVMLRLQHHKKDIFKGIVSPNELFDFTICNPPFHASGEEAEAGTLRKLSNLQGKRVTKATLNFGGKNNELWYEGGEETFVKRMVVQSKSFSSSCFWFSTLVAKSAHLKSIYTAIENSKATDIKIIPMHQGNKISRIVAWTFLTPEQQQRWISSRWK